MTYSPSNEEMISLMYKDLRDIQLNLTSLSKTIRLQDSIFNQMNNSVSKQNNVINEISFILNEQSTLFEEQNKKLTEYDMLFVNQKFNIGRQNELLSAQTELIKKCDRNKIFISEEISLCFKLSSIEKALLKIKYERGYSTNILECHNGRVVIYFISKNLSKREIYDNDKKNVSVINELACAAADLLTEYFISSG